MLNRFVSDGILRRQPLPSDFAKELGGHFASTGRSKLVGSVADTIVHHSTLPVESGWTLPSDVVLPTYRSRYTLNDVQVEELSDLLCKLYSLAPSSVEVSRFAWNYTSVEVRGKQLGTYKSRSQASSIVLAMWKSDIFGSPVLSCPELREQTPQELLRATKINHFLLHTISVSGKPLTHLFASLSWNQSHPQLQSLGKPLTVWSNNLYEPGGSQHCSYTVHQAPHCFTSQSTHSMSMCRFLKLQL